MELLTVAEFNNLVTGVPWVILDTETTGLHPRTDTLLGVAVSSPKGHGYLPTVPYINEYDPVPHPGADPETLGLALRNCFFQSTVINWNLAFDLHHLVPLAGVVPSRLVDPMVGWWMLAEEADHSLKGVAEFVLGTELPGFNDLKKQTQAHVNERLSFQRETYAQELKRQGINLKDGRPRAKALFPDVKVRPQDIPVDWLAPYAVKDPLLTGLLWFDYIQPALQREGLLSLFHTYEMKYLPVLYQMEHDGVCVDEAKLHAKLAEVKTEAEAQEALIWKCAGHPFNVGSDIQLKRVLFEEMRIKPSGRKTDKGADSLDEEAFKMLADSNSSNPIFTHLIQWRKKDKDRQMVDGLLKEVVGGKVYGRLNQTGTATGRLSSEKPNLQNQKKPEKGETDDSIRAAFVAEPGRMMVAADYSQLELRILADRTADPVLVDCYNSGRDLHDETQQRLGLADRRLAKVLNFLVTYGGGPKKYRENLLFQAGIDRPAYQCKGDVDSFYDAYARIRPWKQEVIDEARRTGVVRTILGRARHMPDLYSDDPQAVRYAERQACNTPIQGTAADIVMCAMILATTELSGYDATLRLQVHDELVFDCDKDVVDGFQRDLKDAMGSILPNALVPIVAEVGIGPSWGEAKA